MTPDIYSSWLKAQGHVVVQTESAYWHSESWAVFQSFPYHRQITPSDGEFNQLFHRHRALAVRYSAPPGSHIGKRSYHVICDDSLYVLDRLSSWARKNVRRGLRECRVEQIEFDRYVDCGWRMWTDTLTRQGRRPRINQERWVRKHRAAAALPGFEVWAAFTGEQIVATLLTFQMDECLYLLHQQSARSCLASHSNNALAYSVTSRAFHDAQTKLVFYGMESVDAPSSVDEFKFRMGYRKAPVTQCVMFSPRARPFINRGTFRLLKALNGLVPGQHTISKAHGLLRLALEA